VDNKHTYTKLSGWIDEHQLENQKPQQKAPAQLATGASSHLPLLSQFSAGVVLFVNADHSIM
jgi:hypothetical protein